MAKKIKFVDEKMLEFWTEQNLNALFISNHGTGKSTMIIDTWNKMGIKWAYFSGATLDPWVDFVGIPQKVVDPNTNQASIEIIPPKWILEDVEAIFVDELSRSHKKIRNAIMEAVQFKTINGHKLGKLRVVWAAINPDDEEGTYDVDKLDPAQKDRFHLWVELPNEPCLNYFTKKFGEMGANAVAWWETQSPETKKIVSPRRLDYALEAYEKDVDLNYVLPEGANVKNLIERISGTSFFTELNNLYTNKDVKGMTEFLSDEEKFNSCKRRITENRNLYSFCLNLMPEEKISQLIAENTNVQVFALQNATTLDNVRLVLQEIYTANVNKELCLKIKSHMDSIFPDEINDMIKNKKLNPNAKIHKGLDKDNGYSEILKNISKSSIEKTTDRINAFNKIKDEIPNKLSKSDALDTLKLLEDIINRSHQSVLDKSMGELTNVINLVIDNLEQHKFTNFRNSYPKMFKYLLFREDFIYVK